MNRHQFTRVIGAAVVAVSLSSLALAETSTKPTDADGSPQVSSPYWNPQGAGGSSSQFGEALMEKTVLAVPQARADATVATWQYRRAGNTLNISADNLRRDFTESEEYTAAVNDLKQAHRDLENARLDALKGIRSSDDYAAIESMRKALSEQIADERDQDNPSLNRLAALAQLKMQSVAPVRAVEQDRIESSSAVRDAKARLLDAAKRVARIERDFAHEVRDSIELADARKAKEDARIAMLASAAYLGETRIARDIAVRYAYLSRGLLRPAGNGVGPYNGYGTAYTYGGYGAYGYGTGYGGYGPVEYGLGSPAGGFTAVAGPVGYTGNTPIGGGSNAFTGSSGNAFTGPTGGR